MVSSASAALKIAGHGELLRFDPAEFPPQMKAHYEIFKAKCTKCHSQQRIVISFLSGNMPITGQTFDMDSLKTLSFRMCRKTINKPDKLITKEQIKPIYMLLKYMMEESSR
ncbi:MAG: hypothetical protein A2X83_02005 [Desulfuromonadales bacterium GWD2_54_10]|nr:MAG: hypothetical protein A2X83_02005 [Desulfuromonadales bacterium GWD2_54_10]